MIGYLREPPGEIEITLSEMAENFSAQSRARVIFIDQNGIVIGDSVRIGALLGQYLDRAEVGCPAGTGGQQHSI